MLDLIRDSLKIERVSKMKNPTILMNDKDLEAFIEQVESQVENLKVGENLRYQGIPIIGRKHIEKGKCIIYDEIGDKMFD